MTFDCKEILGGFAEIDFYLLTEVSNFPRILTDQNSNQLVFTPEEFSVDASIKPDSISVNVNKKQGASGIIHQITIKMEFFTRSEALEQLLEQYEKLPGIVHAKLNTNFQKIYGSDLEPLYLVYEVNDGKKIDDDAVTTIEIKGETAKRPVFYTV
ncbi:hypothetical protein LXD69_10120 [Flavobacterium sediminilitoris]|uniref:Uncharacterized protein n=1 Tax=Flavobacterium sediminilitoris TaxID=2024526 RepID=A0ABY4HJI1_9FLAO|nr:MULTISPECIES: hypothetical protein [Flavobacterium]UOX32407.1 hypothetical protein LXD69_10120 [Flavobacterium sediminilitoris]